MICYINSVTILSSIFQYCIAIGQKRITYRSTKRRVYSIAFWQQSKRSITKHLLTGQRQMGELRMRVNRTVPKFILGFAVLKY